MAEIFKSRDKHFNLYESKEVNESISDYKLRDSVFQNKIPSRLKRTFCLSICLVIIGLCFLVFGILKATESADIQDAFAFWILSFLCLIPGVYYSFQFIRAKKELNKDFRREILDEIPTL